MHDKLTALLVVISLAAAAITLGTLPTWWGFWYPDRREARRYEQHRRKRIAALIALGVPPNRATLEAEEQLLREANETVRLIRETSP